ncbi:DUF302 domain-containing protein [Streptomycetaceae bacterium NBC_01309]
MPYDRTIRVSRDFATTVADVREALAAQGFGIASEIDMAATLKERLGEDMEDYLILGACNPSIARQTLRVDRSIGVMLPCNVVVRRDGDTTVVQTLDPHVMLAVTGRPELEAAATEATHRLNAALSSLTCA